VSGKLGWDPPVTDLMHGPFTVDWQRLNGWRAELVRPVRHEGVECREAIVEPPGGRDFMWRLVLRSAGFYVNDQARWDELYPDRAPPDDWWRDTDGSWLVGWRDAVVMEVDPYQLRTPGVLLTRLPRQLGPFERLARRAEYRPGGSGARRASGGRG